MTLHQQAIDVHNADPHGDIYLLDSPTTRAKHSFYRQYLDAWLPEMLLDNNRRIRIVDAYAGSGRYAGTERPGSPQVAAASIAGNERLAHLLDSHTRVLLQCIENNPRRAQHLEKELDLLPTHNVMTHQVLQGTFSAAWREELGRVENTKGFLEPTLIYIDGFGYTGFPMDLMAKILHYESCELLINYPWYTVSNWATQTNDAYKEQVLDRLYGNPEWRAALHLPEEAERGDHLFNHYGDSLADQGWRGATLRITNPAENTSHHLVYGTTSETGMNAFKKAAWALTQQNTVQYSRLLTDAANRAGTPLTEQAVTDDLAQAIIVRRTGTRVTYAQLEQDITWHPTATPDHLQRALRNLEALGHIPKVLHRDRNKTFGHDAVFYVARPQTQGTLF